MQYSTRCRRRHIPSPEWVTLTPYASELFSGTMGILASRANSQVALGVNGVSVQASVPDGIRGSAYQASEQAIQDFTDARLKEMEERYAAYDVIPAGTVCCLQLNSDLDLGAAHAPRRSAALRDHPNPIPIMRRKTRIEPRLAAAVMLLLLSAGCASQRQTAAVSREAALARRSQNRRVPSPCRRPAFPSRFIEIRR